jgi:hypothetical protein
MGNPLGPGTENLTANLPSAVAKRLRTCAKQSDMKIGEYVRSVLTEISMSQIVYKRVRHEKGVAKKASRKRLVK